MNDHGKVGVIGVGAIGSCFVRRILAHNLKAVAYDTNVTALKSLVGANVEIAKNAADLASKCNVIVTCVTDPAAVEAAVLGPGGVIEALQPNTLVLETTTSTPTVTRKLATRLATYGAEIVDAPVSRGVPAAENGTLSIMLGGEQSAVDRAVPILKMFGTD
ncbi:MAG: NAD(P)-binding domain-containing protein, partial [Candidatus Methylopumilus sp.]